MRWPVPHRGGTHEVRAGVGDGFDGATARQLSLLHRSNPRFRQSRDLTVEQDDSFGTGEAKCWSPFL